MNKNRSITPFLLIETPRAGKWNHRHIVAPGVLQQAYLDIIETARQKSEGDNFLAVGHDNKVKQIKDNRYAPELLILAGVDTKRLSKNKKQALQDSLTSLLRSVDKLVTEDIDWNKEGETDPVVREELAVWFDQQFKDVETIAWNQKLKRLSKKIMSATIAIALVSLGFYSIFPGTGDENSNAKKDSDVIAANQLIGALSNAQSSVDRDAITKELGGLKLIENQEGKMKISADMKGTDLTSMARARVFPEEISGLFSSKGGDNIHLDKIAKDLIACKEAIIIFAGLSDTFYTPFITNDQVGKLKKKIENYRDEDKNEFYSGVISGGVVSENKRLESSCAGNLAKNDTSLKFLKKCYEDYGSKVKEDFWENAKPLLKSCGEVKL